MPKTNPKLEAADPNKWDLGYVRLQRTGTDKGITISTHRCWNIPLFIENQLAQAKKDKVKVLVLGFSKGE